MFHLTSAYLKEKNQQQMSAKHKSLINSVRTKRLDAALSFKEESKNLKNILNDKQYNVQEGIKLVELIKNKMGKINQQVIKSEVKKNDVAVQSLTNQKFDDLVRFKKIIDTLNDHYRTKKDELERIKRTYNETTGGLMSDQQKEIMMQKEKEDQNLTDDLEAELRIQRTLDFMFKNRQKLINQVKKKCQFVVEDLQDVIYKENQQNSILNGRKKNFQNVKKRIISVKNQIYKSGSAQSQKFVDSLMLQLDNIQQKMQMDEIYEKKNIEQQELDDQTKINKKFKNIQQEEEFNKNNQKTQIEKQQYLTYLQSLKNDFNKLQIIQKGKLKHPSEIFEHIQFFKEQTHSLIESKDLKLKEIENIKNEINQLKHDLKAKNFIMSQDSQQQKIYDFENQLTDQQFLTKKKQNYNIKYQNILDECCLSVSRILYQFSNQKKINVKVNQADIPSLLSKAGLKLERMLFLLQKKKKNLKLYNIKFNINQEKPPDSIGLNKHASQNIFQTLNGQEHNLDNEINLYENEKNHIQQKRQSVKDILTQDSKITKKSNK